MTDAATRLGEELWSAAQVAAHFGWRRENFSRRKAELEAHGFPKPLPVSGKYQPIAIMLWEIEASTGRKLDAYVALEAAGMGKSTERVLAARAQQLAAGLGARGR